ncbi:MAG: metal ABC transporter permease [bacterium]
MKFFLTYNFMQRALLAGIFIANTCAILGVFLVLRKDAMLGHGLAHITFGGVALGLFLNILPMTAALLVAVLCALGIIKLREKAGVYEDTAIGIFSSIGLALGIILASLSGDFNAGLMSYLFGDIMAISSTEVWVSMVLTIITFAIIVIFYQELLFVTFDPDSAKASGIKAGRLESILILLTAIVVVLGMKIVGLLLVTAIIVIPAAGSLQIAKSFFSAIIISMLVASLSVAIGLWLAFYLNLPASGTVILLSSVFFLILFSSRAVRSGIRIN